MGCRSSTSWTANGSSRQGRFGRAVNLQPPAAILLLVTVSLGAAAQHSPKWSRAGDALMGEVRSRMQIRNPWALLGGTDTDGGLGAARRLLESSETLDAYAVPRCTCPLGNTTVSTRPSCVMAGSSDAVSGGEYGES